MQKLHKGFRYYFECWRALFPCRRALRWRGTWLQNEYCRDCQYCCGPQDSNEPFPMALLPAQIHPGLSDNFYMLNADTAYLDARGCKASTDHGCRLELAQRPVSCGLFPLVPANGGLYLYKICPAVLFTPLNELADLGLEAARWLTGFTLMDLRHISLDIPAQTLAERYISLNISLFDLNGVELRLD
ncbi:hypothetical protein [uncultured Desulfovibrio sp.]|uniref:hypothetical protein n=1 Tax=uncultured Desulfovibrio sp. TaxID=167968 RepID=UPI0026023C36|nr:hypothetical protein [uncultured Desulfovibrio sp.]